MKLIAVGWWQRRAPHIEGVGSGSEPVASDRDTLRQLMARDAALPDDKKFLYQAERDAVLRLINNEAR